MNILDHISSSDRACFAVLVDPDKAESSRLEGLVTAANGGLVDFFFVGGSHISGGDISRTILYLKDRTSVPVVLFPGSVLQIDPSAHAMLFLSLISGRNPEYLIGQHVIASPYLRTFSQEIIPTGYMLIEGGCMTTATYMSSSLPLPANKPQLAASTALAGEMLGMKLIYADTGSGAQQCVSPEMVRKIKEYIRIPLVVGGGINSKEKAVEMAKQGADVIVAGNGIESRPLLLNEIAASLKKQ